MHVRHPRGGALQVVLAPVLSLAAACSGSDPGSPPAIDGGPIIAGRVLGPDGRGMSGVVVEAVCLNGSGARGHTTSTTDGEFLIQGLSHRPHDVFAHSTGLRSWPKEFVWGSKTNLVLRLLRTGSVAGRVVDPRGQPLEDSSAMLVCNVRAMHEFDRAFGLVVQRECFVAAEEGEFEIQEVPEGHYVLEGIAPGHASSFSEPFEVCPGQTTSGLVLQLSHGGVLTGLVVDAGGAPIAGAEVKTADGLWSFPPSAELFGPLDPSALTKTTVTTDAGGRFELIGMTPGHYLLEVEAEGFARTTLNGVRVLDGQRTELSVPLARGAIIRGVVRGSDARVAAGSKVMLTPVDAGDHWSHRTSCTDSAGRYVIEGVQAGTYKLAAARSDADDPFDVVRDMRESELELTVAAGAAYELDLRLWTPGE